MGDENPDTGTVLRSEHLSVAYFEQNRETLDPTLTVLKTLCPQGDHVDFQGRRVHIRSYLDRFLFSQGQMEMAVGKLSGGEQSRLLIARLMLNSANLLVLDEPTNDLDMATLAVLEDCLTEFQGAVLLVTHDRYFLDQVAQKILAFTPEGVIPFDGLSQWEVWYTNFLAKTGSNSTQSKPQLTTIKESVAPKAPEKKRKLSYNDQREFDSMESNIHTAEARLKALEAESLLKENLSNSKKLGEISKEMKEVQARIDYLYIRWEELEN